MDKRLAVNRNNWDERTPAHAVSDLYDVEGFKKGRITLTDIERQEVGDVSGKTLLHLQCHFGLDTMSWSRLGAKATGVDFSDTAIGLARALNEELGLGVRFISSNIYDLPDALEEQFDIVFTSYGVLNWLPDIARWAEVVRNHLKPAGVFYIVEFHPFAAVFEASETGDMVPTYRYFHHELFFEGGEPSYAGKEIIETPTYEWQHSLSDIVCADRRGAEDRVPARVSLHLLPGPPRDGAGQRRLVAASEAQRELSADVLNKGVQMSGARFNCRKRPSRSGPGSAPPTASA